MGSTPGWPSQGMHRAVDVDLVVQENALVELDDVVVVALADVLTEVMLALDVIVDDEADVVKFALDVIETEDVLPVLELAVEEADVTVADTLAELETLVVVVLETVLEAVVQFAMSLAPCTLDAETAFPTDFFK